ncbi:unannotated protein [freshwater metagenome]|uniref:Unannotated protein n=1 Tax=freshwater metagenome TaxID=449393 RepID=A0A6J7EBM7_9ZZZZ
MNWAGSDVSSCQSMMRLSQSMSSTPLPCLYAQCAATPHSADWCIPFVRICTSIVLPSWSTTVVWSDWYRLNFGIAM